MVLPIQQDGEKITSNPGEDAEAAFLRAFEQDGESPSGDDELEDKKPKPPVDEAEDDSEETLESEEAEGDETETDDESGEPEEKPKTEARKRVILEPDVDAFIKHKVDGKDIEISVKDLTRLYGQEAALTRKSQETSDVRKIVDANGARYTAGLEALMTNALKEFQPYADLNFLALAKDPSVSAEDLANLQAQATAKYNTVKFLETSLDQTVKAGEEARITALKKTGAETWKVLSNPETGIKDWGTPLYDEVRTYAISGGIPVNTVNELVDPVAIKMLHKAMLYDKGQAALVKVVKRDKEPKRIIKSASNAVISKSKGVGTDAAMAKLSTTGTIEDAADVFYARGFQ